MIEGIEREAQQINTIEELKDWTRRSIRPFLPHESLISCHGHIHAAGVGMDFAVTIDYPAEYLQRLRNRAGGIDSALLRRWLDTREPVVFEIDDHGTDYPAGWLQAFRDFDLRNALAHAIYDTERCVGTYHCFHRIPGRLDGTHVEAIRQLTPILHDVLCRVTQNYSAQDAFSIRLTELSPRAREIVRWVGIGKSNSEIASIAGLSENTIKHHLTRIFDRLGVDSRSQLIARLAEQELRVAPGYVTRIL